LWFKITIATYCASTAAVSRQLCQITPYAKVVVKNCKGESFLLSNPITNARPTMHQYDFISRKGNTSNYIEASEFSVTLAETWLAVYNPGEQATLGYNDVAYFQISLINTLDSQGKFEEIVPTLRPGDQWFEVGRLASEVVLSGSIYEPSSVKISWYWANKTDASGAIVNTNLEYRLYYIRIGSPQLQTTATLDPQYIMSAPCAVLMNGVALGNWSTAHEETFEMSLNGGLYMFNVLARPPGWANWNTTQCTDPCLAGSFEALPFTFDPFKPLAGTDTEEFKLGLTVIVSAFGVLCAIIAIGFYFIQKRAQKRVEAQELMDLQNQRRAAIERGEKYNVSKKKRQLSLWERLTGEIVTKEDEEYDDCLSSEERRKVEMFRRVELGADSELDTREIPSV